MKLFCRGCGEVMTELIYCLKCKKELKKADDLDDSMMTHMY